MSVRYGACEVKLIGFSKELGHLEVPRYPEIGRLLLSISQKILSAKVRHAVDVLGDGSGFPGLS
jgi:hypothetical protein